ncbi:MAG: hypothetical protein L6R36_008884 [Xanthoria steineri]|nr:MAG: hypothetical protein L6R36_008884 [Xanthoria steineri]
MPSEPELVIKSEPAFSIYITDSGASSLESAPLHDLAILRTFGSWAISLITGYLNKQYGGFWTAKEILQIWRHLRREYEQRNYVDGGQVLYVWREEYPNAVPGSKEEQDYKERKVHTFKQFFEEMASELVDSEFTVDLELDRRAEDDLTVLSSLREEPGSALRDDNNSLDPDMSQAFKETSVQHHKSKYTSKELQEQWLVKREKNNAFNKDLTDWIEGSAKGEKDLGPKPSTLDPVTLKPNPRYYYKAPPPKNVDTGLAE